MDIIDKYEAYAQLVFDELASDTGLQHVLFPEMEGIKFEVVYGQLKRLNYTYTTPKGDVVKKHIEL